ncbi:MAG TPA: hypothetical protein VHE79_04680 [Spirochaetia bacterium]
MGARTVAYCLSMRMMCSVSQSRMNPPTSIVSTSFPAWNLVA